MSDIPPESILRKFGSCLPPINDIFRFCGIQPCDRIGNESETKYLAWTANCARLVYGEMHTLHSGRWLLSCNSQRARIQCASSNGTRLVLSVNTDHNGSWKRNICTPLNAARLLLDRPHPDSAVLDRVRASSPACA